MKVTYHIINGRGHDGLKFQLAQIKDEMGNNFKGQYDMARHFSSTEELEEYITDIVETNAPEHMIEGMVIEPMRI